ncbi:MAG: hypothetical protein WCY57_07615, partial [Micavibrio sp.]
MTLRQDIVEDICALTARQVQELYPTLQLMFIPHENGQFGAVVEAREHETINHPAAKIARAILEKNTARDLSGFLGMAIEHKVKWFGLSSREYILALFNVNLGDFETAKDARRGLYHMAWHAIELFDVRQRPQYISKFRSGPLVPKRSPMNFARLNLQADLFSAIMCGLMGDEDSLDDLAHRRAQDSVAPVYTRRAEDYPFVIAHETARFALERLREMNPERPKFIYYARQVAIEVSQTFDEANIRQWWGFSEPAQDMAWRDFSANTILGCAVNTSADPFVRATAHLVSDLTQIRPLSRVDVSGTYNAFAGQEQNQMLHREMIEKTFQEAMARGVEMESGQPLLLAAYEQNEKLTEGRIIGWCANALQAAARAFENALVTGVSPSQAAALEFESTKNETDWDTLKKIGETVTEQRRSGFTVTLNSLADMCNGQPAFSVISASLQNSINTPVLANAPK